MAATENALQIARTAAQAASDKMATDIVGRDVSGQLAIADVFLIVSGRTERQVGAIVDAIEDALLDVGEHTLRSEGHGANRWVLLDYGDLVVHIFHVEDRVTYALERLWRDCPALELNIIDHEEGAS